ncbi:MAG: BrnA antitoxin family protein [Chloroflexi bacterium]|nr:BrnA antitoxin family protein [Chloroflexota bacterium]
MKKRITGNKSLTDWARVDAMKDENIDLSDAPEITPEMFAKAVVRRGLKPVPGKAQLTLRVDSDVLAWFKAQGRGYQTRINALLRAYMEASQQQMK